MVWGDGVEPSSNPDPQLHDSNFYFSLTRLKATGTVVITDLSNPMDIETHEVTGTTWMDHEWGKFGSKKKPVKWILQDMQLDNGVCISNYSLTQPSLNNSTAGMATVQLDESGESFYVKSTMTPTESTLIDKIEYFTKVKVEIPVYGVSVIVESLMPNQVFKGNIYEGVASVMGSMTKGEVTENVAGTAWIEQSLK